MSLPIKWIDQLFTRFALCYGRDFLRRWEGMDLEAVKASWAHELRGFASQPEALAFALDNLPERPPNVFEFRALARRAPPPPPLLLPAPKADPERVKAELAKLALLRHDIHTRRLAH